MSSLRNAIRRKIHKERSQPAERRGMGLLEKKKDYKERAVDYHRKEDKVRDLREKAALRNPDEFYFGMVRAKTKDGEHVLRQGGGAKRTAAAMKKMTAQDLSYMQHKAVTEARKAERLAETLHCLSGEARGKHTIFFDSEAEMREFDPVRHFDTAPELAGRAYNRVKVETLRSKDAVRGVVDGKALRAAERERTKKYRELAARLVRKRKIGDVVDSLQTQKNLQGKGKRTKVVRRDRFGDVVPEATVHKWAKERKK